MSGDDPHTTTRLTAELQDDHDLAADLAERLAQASGKYGLSESGRRDVLRQIVAFVGLQSEQGAKVRSRKANRGDVIELALSRGDAKDARASLLTALERLVDASVRGLQFKQPLFVRAALLCHMHHFDAAELAEFTRVDHVLRAIPALSLNFDRDHMARATEPLMLLYHDVASAAVDKPLAERRSYYRQIGEILAPLAQVLCAASPVALQLLSMASDERIAPETRRRFFVSLGQIEEATQRARWRTDPSGLHLEPAGPAQSHTPSMLRIERLVSRWQQIADDDLMREAVSKLPLLLDDDEKLLSSAHFVALLRDDAVPALAFAGAVRAEERADAHRAMRCLLHQQPNAALLSDFAASAYWGDKTPLYRLIAEAAALEAPTAGVVMRFAVALEASEAPVTSEEVYGHLFDERHPSLRNSSPAASDILELLMQPVLANPVDGEQGRAQWLSDLDAKLRRYT